MLLRKDMLQDLHYASRLMGPWLRLYTALTDPKAIRLAEGCLPKKSEVTDPGKEYLNADEEARTRDLYLNIYLGACTLGILGKKSRVKRWLESLDRWNWTTSAARLLSQIGLAQGLGIREGGGPKTEDMLHHARAYSAPGFPERRDIWGAWQVLRKTFIELLSTTAYLQGWFKIKADVSATELSELRNSSFYGRDILLGILAKSGAFSIQTSTIDRYLEDEKSF